MRLGKLLLLSNLLLLLLLLLTLLQLLPLLLLRCQCCSIDTGRPFPYKRVHRIEQQCLHMLLLLLLLPGLLLHAGFAVTQKDSEVPWGPEASIETVVRETLLSGRISTGLLWLQQQLQQQQHRVSAMDLLQQVANRMAYRLFCCQQAELFFVGLQMLRQIGADIPGFCLRAALLTTRTPVRCRLLRHLYHQKQLQPAHMKLIRIMQVLELLFTNPSYDAELARRYSSIAAAAADAAAADTAAAARAGTGAAATEDDASCVALPTEGASRDTARDMLSLGSSSSNSSNSSSQFPTAGADAPEDCWPAGGSAAIIAGALCEGYVSLRVRRQILQQQQQQQPQQQTQQHTTLGDRSFFTGCSKAEAAEAPPVFTPERYPKEALRVQTPWCCCFAAAAAAAHDLAECCFSGFAAAAAAAAAAQSCSRDCSVGDEGLHPQQQLLQQQLLLSQGPGGSSATLHGGRKWKAATEVEADVLQLHQAATAAAADSHQQQQQQQQHSFLLRANLRQGAAQTQQQTR
ncbi:hypothetical protein ENH_00030430 [Eimeria necatrix]|uniref:Uncharacterized protein n=1 Tax=Eimeria necatrix TaxID=51315 RepID=U6MSC5_9EIME|nr:hypothetical protein ENH_00030430 [Eimeria necatrix]CDJ67092.1 hypothetical protein ENH_00030430 [Eimeria necatrix]